MPRLFVRKCETFSETVKIFGWLTQPISDEQAPRGRPAERGVAVWQYVAKGWQGLEYACVSILSKGVLLQARILIAFVLFDRRTGRMCDAWRSADYLIHSLNPIFVPQS